MDRAKGKWAKKLPGVFWAYRTTKRILTRETPFSLAYGTEAVIPIDISMLTLRVERVVPDQNDTLLRLMLDHSEERHQQVQIHIVTYQQQIQAAHYKKVKHREFQLRDLVLKRVIQSTGRRTMESWNPTGRVPILSLLIEAMGHTP